MEGQREEEGAWEGGTGKAEQQEREEKPRPFGRLGRGLSYGAGQAGMGGQRGDALSSQKSPLHTPHTH